MTLHLVRLPVDLGALAAFAVANRASDDDGGYALHLALRRRFGTAGPQPFRLFAEGPAAPHLLGYAADADALTEAAALPALDPLLDAVFGAAQVRAMPDIWREGARFGFEVRVRPIVRFSKRLQTLRAEAPAAGTRDGWWARAGEVDAWIAARTRGGEEGQWAENGRDPDAVQDAVAASPSREATYVDWLATRLTDAATLDRTELRRFRRTRTHRSSHGKAGRPGVEGPDALLAGTLTVRDPAAFGRTLARGVGRHAAFGFGMLLLSPAPRD